MGDSYAARPKHGNEGFIQVWEYTRRLKGEAKEKTTTRREDPKGKTVADKVSKQEETCALDEVTDNQLRELARIMSCISMKRSKVENHKTVFYRNQQKVDLSLNAWAAYAGFDPLEALAQPLPPEDEEQCPQLPDGLVHTSFVKKLRGMGLTTAQAETEAAEVAAGEMADTVRIFSRMLSSRAAALSKNTGTTLRNLPSIGEQQPVFRCECCDDRVSTVWYVPPMTQLLEGKSKNTVAALREIHRKTFRRICNKKFHIMDLLCKPSAPALVRKKLTGPDN